MFEVIIKDVEGSGKYVPDSPSYENAGIDLKAAEDVFIKPHTKALVKTGIATAFAPYMVGIIKDRSGMAKKGIITSGGVIDSSYRGEWGVLLYNETDEGYQVCRGDRIAQVLFFTCLHPILKLSDSLPDSSRGTGGFGSTGK